DTENSATLRERLAAREAALTTLEAQLQELRQQLLLEREATVGLREKLSSRDTLLQQERQQHDEKLQLLQSAREQMQLEFRNLANEILEQKGRQFGESSREQL